MRVYSDGTGNDTVITDAHGKELQGVTAARIDMAVNNVNELRLHVTAAKIDVHAEVRTVTFICPCCTFVQQHKCDD